MAVPEKDILQLFYVELIQRLPLESDKFFGIVKKLACCHYTGDKIKAENTRSSKVSYFLSHVIEPGAKDYLPILLKAIEESKVLTFVKLVGEMCTALGGTYCNYSTSYSQYVCMYIHCMYS